MVTLMTRRLPWLALLAPLALAAGCDDQNLTWPVAATYEAAAPAPLACIPNLDGAIEAYEMAPTLNQLATYRVSPPLPTESQEGRPVDLAGTVDDSGRRIWDWSAADPSDRNADLEAEPLAGRWYAASFPGGEFVLPADAAGHLEGVYSHDEAALKLYGVASALADPPEGRTLLVYQEPVVFLPFPLTLGQSWTQTGIVRNGTLQGLSPWSQDDLYESTVDAAGELRLPDFTFTQALRLYTKVTVKPKAGNREGYVQHQYSFVFECFGEVARATSPLVYDSASDPGKDFPVAREVRRLGWF
jgi:hypothetical protein